MIFILFIRKKISSNSSPNVLTSSCTTSATTDASVLPSLTTDAPTES